MKIDEKYFEVKNSNLNSIDDVLEEEEKILWRDKPHKKSYIWSRIISALPIVLLWLAIDCTFIVFISISMAKGHTPLGFLGFIIPFFALHLIPVWLWILNIVRGVVEIKNIEYAFTSKRIIVRSGVIGIDFKFLYYSEIESVNVRVGLVDKIFKVGDIYINAVSSAAVLNDIKSPYVLGSKLQKIVQDIKADINYPNANRPDTNPGYHTNYTNTPFKK